MQIRLLGIIKKHIIVIMLLSISIIYTFSIDHSLPGDSKVSVILSKSLSQGYGFRDISDIRKPLVNYTGPLFPLILSVVQNFTANLKILKILSLISVIASFYIFTLLLKKYSFGQKAIHIMLFIAIFNPFLHNISNEISTHTFYVLLSFLTVYFIKIYEEKSDIKSVIIISILASLSFLTRWVGLSLFLGPAIYLLLTRKYRHLFVFSSIFLIISLPWAIYTLYLHFTGKAAFLYLTLIFKPYNTEHTSLFYKVISLIIRFARNTGGYYFRNLPAFLFGSYFSDVSLVNFSIITFIKMTLAFIPSFVILRGFIKKLKFNMCNCYVLIYMFVLGMFAEPDIHYLAPLTFFIFIWGYSGISSVFKPLKIRYLLTMLLIVLNIYSMSSSLAEDRKLSITNMSNWIKSNTDESDVFLDYKWFSPIYIYTKRRTVARMSYDKLFKSPKYVYEDSDALVNRYKQISYVLVKNSGDKIHYLESRKAVTDSPNKYIPVYSDPVKDITIYKVKR